MKKYKTEIILLEGWGNLSFDNLIKSIEKSKEISLNKFIFSLGIRFIGETNSEILAKEYKSIDLRIKGRIYLGKKKCLT